MKTCPFCAEEIQDAAVVCKHCGRDLRTGQTFAAPAPTVVVMRPAWSPGIAAVLSLVIPGAGQLYKGHVLSGIVWFFAVVLGYAMLVVPGLILHLCCIVAAASGRPPQIPSTAVPAPPTVTRTAAADAAPSLVPRGSTGLERSLGRAGAVFFHPATAWPTLSPRDRGMLAAAYVMTVVVGFLILRLIWLSPSR